MFDVGSSLRDPLAAAQNALSRAASETATKAGSHNDARMARAAEQAIFSEALMNAMHARLAEIKIAAK